MFSLYSDTITISELTGKKVMTAAAKTPVTGKTALVLYPNPAKNNLNNQINILQNETAQIEIIDMQGKVLLSAGRQLSAGASTQNINISSFAKRTYFVKIKR